MSNTIYSNLANLARVRSSFDWQRVRPIVPIQKNYSTYAKLTQFKKQVHSGKTVVNHYASMAIQTYLWVQHSIN